MHITVAITGRGTKSDLMALLYTPSNEGDDMNECSEADAIGWDYSAEDIDKIERDLSGEMNEFEMMLDYHGLDEQDWLHESSTGKRQKWWNYRKFGKGV